MLNLKKLLGFAFVSGLGLAIDFAIFLLLVALSLSPLAANAVSGSCAVTYVYFASVRRIFSYQGTFLFGLFLAYLVYQIAGVTAASFAVSFLASHFMAPALAKVAILPVTFSANYLFMSLLTRNSGAADLAEAESVPASNSRL